MGIRRARGFTLIEVVVAFAIFALVAGAVFEVFAGASRRAERARERELLWLTAQSVLSELRARPMPWPDHEDGKSNQGRESWALTVEPYDAGTNPDSQWKAFSVSVRVTAGDGRPGVTLRSVETGRAVP